MRIYDIILKKRNGGVLSRDEIKFFIEVYTKGDIPDYQASALCMAIYYMGMNDTEIADLTMAMAESGDMLDLSRFGSLTADKHSTGGVGDKTSLIVAPIVASLGGKVSKMSGRGLGHTGGTVDKLESIPGYSTTIPEEKFISQVDSIGISIIGQSGNLAPADKKLYALRDVTATVDSIPLITSSIMSKKIAAGSHNIVLDVKCGNGAFMKNAEDAEVLAKKMVEIGKLCGRNIAAVITDMNTPLGTNIGNSLEVIEAVEVLKGRVDNDLKEVSIILASELVSLIFGLDSDEARKKVEEEISSGRAYNKMREWITSQGGNLDFIDNTSLFEASKFTYEVKSLVNGYIAETDTELIGHASTVLGAGRTKKEDTIDYSAGIKILKKRGDKVEVGDTLFILYTNNESSLEDAKKRCRKAVKFTDSKPTVPPLVYKIIR